MNKEERNWNIWGSYRTYNNNYYNHVEFELSTLVLNDAMIWNSHFSFSWQKKFTKIHKWHMAINEIKVFVRAMHSVMQPPMSKHSTNAAAFFNTLNHDAKCVESLIKFYSWLLCLGDLRRSSFHQCMLQSVDRQLVWLSWCDIMAMWLKPVSQLQ